MTGVNASKLFPVTEIYLLICSQPIFSKKSGVKMASEVVAQKSWTDVFSCASSRCA